MRKLNLTRNETIDIVADHAIGVIGISLHQNDEWTAVASHFAKVQQA